jgi:hypothetical protein
MYKYLLVEGLLEKDDPTDGFDPLFVTREEQLTELPPVQNVYTVFIKLIAESCTQCTVFITWIAESFQFYYCNEYTVKTQKNILLCNYLYNEGKGPL